MKIAFNKGEKNYIFIRSFLSILSFIFTSTTVSAISLELGVASNSNTPEAAVANALTLAAPPGVCAQLQLDTTNNIELKPNQTHMFGFCNQLDFVDQTQTAPAFKALSARAASSVTSYTANGFYSLNISDITKRLASLRKSSMKHSTKTATLFQKKSLIIASNYMGNQLTGGGASADSIETYDDEYINADEHSPNATISNTNIDNTNTQDESNAGFTASEPGGLTDNRLSGFITGDFVNTEQDETSTLAGYKTGIKALFVGLDYRFTQNIFAGVAVKSLTGDVDLIGNVGTVDVSDNSVSLYGNYNYSERLYFQSTLTVGKGSFDITRKIDFSINNTPFNETASSNPEGDGVGFSVSTGYDYSLPETGISSVFDLTLNYAKTTIDGFIETGAKGFNLQVAEQTIESLSTKASLQINKAISTTYGVIIPEVSAAWTHQFITDGEDIITSFDIDPEKSFRYTTDKLQSDFFTLSLAASMVLPHGIMGFVQYETVLGIDNYTTNAFNIGARIEF